MPKFAILLITYNQENFIARCIESILNQSYKNFKLIISDDSSTDKTLKIANSFKDSRIKCVKTPYNIGINGNLNLAYENVSEDVDFYIFIAGDDKLRVNYLEKIASNFAKMPKIDVLYSQLCVIDKDDNYTFGKDEFYYFCDNETLEKKFHTAFMSGNIFASPGMAMRKKVAQSIFPLSCSFANFQDYAMHCEIFVKGFKYHVLSEILVDYRQLNDERNMSHASEKTTMREKMETNALMDIFLEIKDISLLKRVFEKEIKDLNLAPFKDTIPFFLGKVALLCQNLTRKEWGYRTILNFLASKQNFDLVHKKYGFCFKDYLNLMSNFIQENSKIINNEERFRKKYKKYKRLSKISLFVIVILAILCVLSQIYPKF